MSILPSNAPFSNASFTIKFPGPALQCVNASSIIAKNATMGDLWNKTMSGVDSDSRLAYLLNTTEREGYNNHIFIYLKNYTNTTRQTGSRYSCNLYNASYDVQFTFRGGVQSTVVNRPVIPPSASPLFLKTMGSDSQSLLKDYNTSEAAYLSLYSAISTRLLIARIAYSRIGLLLDDKTSVILWTGIPTCADFPAPTHMLNPLRNPSLCPSGSVVGAIEELFHNVTVSMLSSNIFSNKTAKLPVNVETTRNFYSYEATSLWQAYSVAVAVALACGVLGLHSFLANGYNATNSFSSIMLATRNPELDRLALNGDLGDAKLRYGTVFNSMDGDEGAYRAAFGPEQSLGHLE